MIKKLGAFLLLALILAVLIFTIIIVSRDSPTDVISMEYTFSVKDGVGINLDTDKLNFGGGPNNATLQRKMNISTPYDAMVSISSEGPGILSSNINNFNTYANQPLELTFSLFISEDLALGDYEGEVLISVYMR